MLLRKQPQRSIIILHNGLKLRLILGKGFGYPILEGFILKVVVNIDFDFASKLHMQKNY